MIYSSFPALPILISVSLSLPFVLPFLGGAGIPCDTEDSRLRGVPQHAAGKRVYSFRNVKTRAGKLSAILGVKWRHQWTMRLNTDLIYILFPNSSCLTKWKPGETLISTTHFLLLLIFLRFTSNRPCKFKRLCQILIIVFSNLVASLLIPPQRGMTAPHRKSGGGERSQHEAVVSFEQLLD